MSTESEQSPAAAHYNITSYYRSINAPFRATLRGDRLRIGQPAPDLHLTALDGRSVDLDDLVSGGNVALVFGCWSEGVLVSEMPALDQLHRSLPNGDSLAFIYTREIHPGEVSPSGRPAIEAHRSLDDKLARARAFRDELSLDMPVYADDVEGTTHLAYGALPCFQVVVDRDKKVVHIAEWACAAQLQGVLENLAYRDQRSDQGQPRLSYSETLWCT